MRNTSPNCVIQFEFFALCPDKMGATWYQNQGRTLVDRTQKEFEMKTQHVKMVLLQLAFATAIATFLILKLRFAH
jgi:hypothetical protein